MSSGYVSNKLNKYYYKAFFPANSKVLDCGCATGKFIEASPEKALSEFKKVMKKGGKAVVITPEIEIAGKKFWKDKTHKTPLTPISIKKPSFLNIKRL